MKRLTREWLDKGEDDFRVATSLMRSRKAKVPDAICFHCQQCAEKLLKARLCEDGTPFPKTHDLAALVQLLVRHLPALVEPVARREQSECLRCQHSLPR